MMADGARAVGVSPFHALRAVVAVGNPCSLAGRLRDRLHPDVIAHGAIHRLDPATVTDGAVDRRDPDALFAEGRRRRADRRRGRAIRAPATDSDVEGAAIATV